MCIMAYRGNNHHHSLNKAATRDCMYGMIASLSFLIRNRIIHDQDVYYFHMFGVNTFRNRLCMLVTPLPFAPTVVQAKFHILTNDHTQ